MSQPIVSFNRVSARGHSQGHAVIPEIEDLSTEGLSLNQFDNYYGEGVNYTRGSQVMEIQPAVDSPHGPCRVLAQNGQPCNHIITPATVLKRRVTF